MKKNKNNKLLVGLLCAITTVLFMSQAAFAQKSKPISPAKALKNTKDSLSLVATISKDSVKLADLQSQVEKKTSAKQKAEESAQQIADDNTEAARRLSNNPLDKKLAKKAANLSSEAKSSTRKARSAGEDLDDLNKDITSLQRKNEKDRDKLGKFRTNFIPER